MDDAVSRMVKEFPAETLRLIFSDKSGNFVVVDAARKLRVSKPFIKKWVDENRLPKSMVKEVKKLYRDRLEKIINELKEENNEKVRIRAI